MLTKNSHWDSVVIGLLLAGYIVSRIWASEANPLPPLAGNVELQPIVYEVSDPIILVAGTTLNGNGAVINSSVPSSKWAMVLDGSARGDRITVRDLYLNGKKDGANGILLHECQYAALENVEVVGGNKFNRLWVKGIVIDGDQKGAAFNTLDRVFVGGCKEEGIKFVSDPTKPPFCNRNEVRATSVWACGTGINVERGSTNRIWAATQVCDIGWDIGAISKYNYLGVMDEKSATLSIRVHSTARKNKFEGNWDATKVQADVANSFWEPMN